jgi:hypothetical protein
VYYAFLFAFFWKLFGAVKRGAESCFQASGSRETGGAKSSGFAKKMERFPVKVDESASTKYCVDKALGIDILGSRPSRQGEGTFIRPGFHGEPSLARNGTVLVGYSKGVWAPRK